MWLVVAAGEALAGVAHAVVVALVAGVDGGAALGAFVGHGCSLDSPRPATTHTRQSPFDTVGFYLLAGFF